MNGLREVNCKQINVVFCGGVCGLCLGGLGWAFLSRHTWPRPSGTVPRDPPIQNPNPCISARFFFPRPNSAPSPCKFQRSRSQCRISNITRGNLPHYIASNCIALRLTVSFNSVSKKSVVAALSTLTLN